MYKGITIPDKIIIVENAHKQGFVVPPNNEKVLNTAMNWAEEMIWPETGTWEERRDNAVKFTGILHEYENGHFRMKLNSSAEYSYCGGKLSFWNCDIIAPDGKTFLIGINQELLCNLLKNCTLVNGEVQQEVWLGKQQGNTGLYTVEMDDFQQAIEESKQKLNIKKKTKNYNVGDLVGTLTKKFIYLGEYTRYNYMNYRSYDYINWSKRTLVYKPLDKEERCHLYLECSEATDGTCSYSLVERDNKSPYCMIETNHREITGIETVKDILKDQLYPSLNVLQYVDYSSIEDVLEDLKTYDKNHTYYLKDNKGN